MAYLVQESWILSILISNLMGCIKLKWDLNILSCKKLSDLTEFYITFLYLVSSYLSKDIFFSFLMTFELKVNSTPHLLLDLQNCRELVFDELCESRGYLSKFDVQFNWLSHFLPLVYFWTTISLIWPEKFMQPLICQAAKNSLHAD